MTNEELQHAVANAERRCGQSGRKLTEKRRRILALLLQSNIPLSAYELAGIYNSDTNADMPAMSIYRILDFLVFQELVHRLASTNKYVACSHIACANGHEVSQFLICRRCHKVKEVGVQQHIVDQLSRAVRSAGFMLIESQLEFDCLCEQCLNRAA